MIGMTKIGQNLLCAMGVALLLSGCSNNVAEQSRPCPPVKVLQDAAYMTRFAGDSEDLADTSFEARIARSQSMCTYVIDTETGATSIRTELSVEFAASRGPNNADSAAKFNYWVRITGPGGEHMPGDQNLDVEIPFTAAKIQGIAQDQVEILLPLRKGENGEFYRINLGLVVTEKELAFNRRNPQF